METNQSAKVFRTKSRMSFVVHAYPDGACYVIDAPDALTAQQVDAIMSDVLWEFGHEYSGWAMASADDIPVRVSVLKKSALLPENTKELLVLNHSTCTRASRFIEFVLLIVPKTNREYLIGDL